jgi:hypothetical protein
MITIEDIEFKNITGFEPVYYSKLEKFIDNLEEETIFLPITFQRVINSVLIFGAFHNNEIVGLGGVEKKYGIFRSYTIVNKKYHRLKIGKNLNILKIDTTFRYINFLLSIIDERNSKSIRMITSFGFKQIGKRQKLNYYGKYVNIGGLLLFYFIKVTFPFLILFDRFR